MLSLAEGYLITAYKERNLRVCDKDKIIMPRHMFVYIMQRGGGGSVVYNKCLCNNKQKLANLIQFEAFFYLVRVSRFVD